MPGQGDYAQPSIQPDNRVTNITRSDTKRTLSTGMRETREDTREQTLTRGNLRSHAASIAARVFSDPHRVRSFIEAGITNPEWTTAVCRAGSRQKQWTQKVKDDAGLKDLALVVEVWATRDTVVGVNEDASRKSGITELIGLSSEEACATASVPAERDEERETVRVMMAAPVLSNCYKQSCHHARDVCLFCTLFEWCNTKPRALPEKSTKVFDQWVKAIPSTVESGWLKQMALAHNAEQHALNGNTTPTALVPLSKEAHTSEIVLSNNVSQRAILPGGRGHI